MADVVQRQFTVKGQPKVAVTDPEYTISIIGLVASFCGQPIVGLVLTILALKQSKRDNRYNVYAFIGFIISIALVALYALFFVFYIGVFGLTFLLALTGGAHS